MSDPKVETKPEAKKVKIRVVRPIMINRVEEPKTGVIRGQVVEPKWVKRGEGANAKWENVSVIEVSEEEAKLFCDTQFDGHFAFGGERANDNTKHDYRRAVRVA